MGNARVQVTLRSFSEKKYYSGKAICITYSECGFVPLAVQYAIMELHAPCYVVFCGLSGGTIFLRIIT